ncbi:VWA domain-containing protein [Marinobacter sp. C2H3]|uniref:VWA domain-containing protein n=1 Tax=Marinobacter sp. C2H3 TaxID=3119003 RepID=UPI00300EA9D5
MADLHFLRPLWLLLMLAAPLLVFVVRRAGRSDSGWGRWIPAALLTPLIRPSGQKQPGQRSPLLPLIAALVVVSVALAGPAWRKAPTPLRHTSDSLVMVLDLSLSMLATDAQPDRLTRARRKIRDILAARPDGLNALVVYAADSHVVTPLTDDTRTIESLLDVLDPVIMPAQGNRADLGVAEAVRLLRQGAPGRGRILLLTDQVAPRYASRIDDLLADTPYTLSTIAVGTRAGGPMPLPRNGFIRDDDGKIVITKADPEGLAELAAETGGGSASLTLDGRDIHALGLDNVSATDSKATDDDKTDQRTVQRWQDDGYWLLWLVIPLVLLAWRRGGFATLALLLIALMPLAPRPASAASWDDLWQREDQRAPALIQKDPEQAAQELDEPDWRASALYRSGQYEQAAKLFDQVPGAQADYNRGNALARAGKLREALRAYDDALQANPDFKDAAANRALVKKLLEQQQNQKGNSSQGSGSSGNQNNRNNQGSQNGQNKSGQDQGGQTGNGNRGQQGGDSQSNNTPGSQNGQSQSAQDGQGQNNAHGNGQPNDRTGDQQPQNGDAQDGNNGSGEPPGKAASPAPGDTSPTPLSQGQEQWLRRIPDDPGGLLRRKFLQQYEQQQTPSDEGDTPW